MAEELKLSRGWNHLGEIAKTVGDLRGLRTVIHELIQNADDAPGATRMRFTVCDDVLEVWNDGEFDRCSDITASECELLPTTGYRCDFHSFRSMGSGDKRNRPGTTGAFGIGFTAVYQLTDKPELISNGEHWAVDEMASEDSRITRLPTPKGHDGTTFRLPWATEPSAFRTAIRQQVLTHSTIAGFVAELLECVPLAMPFLKKLQAIEIVHDEERNAFDRRVDGQRLEVVSDGGDHWRWLVLRGEFDERASELRARFPEQIEEGRPATVAVAFPLELEAASGVLYATLPTEESAHLPILINAEFYPASDRKRIRFDDAPESMFNRDALRTAARIVAAALPDLPDELGDDAFVAFLIDAMELSRRVTHERIESSYQAFWTEITQALPQAFVVPTANGGHDLITRARLWREPAEGEAVAVLADLGIRLVHAEHKDAWYRLRGPKVNLGELALGDLVVSLSGAGASQRRRADELPGLVGTALGLESLWSVMELLVATSGRANQESRNALMGCAIVPGRDGALWPFKDLVTSDGVTRDTLIAAGVSDPFLDTDRLAECPHLVAFVQDVNAKVAVELLERAVRAKTISSDIDSAALLRWFHRRQDDLAEDDLERLARLPIFPTADGPRPLSGLALPGDFEDPLRLARLVVVDGIEDMRQLLRRLGARPLSLASYCTQFVPRATEDRDLSEENRFKLLRLLATRLSEVRDDQVVREALRPLRLVPCQDGDWRAGDFVYLSSEVKTVLGPDAIVAAIPEDRRTAYQELLSWLGVAADPRPDDVIVRCRQMVAGPSWHRRAANAVIEHLAHRYAQDRAVTEVAFTGLKDFGWLPAEGDESRGFRPEAVFTTFRRHLFSSQAKFLDLPLSLQRRAADFLEWLGVEGEPTTQQVVAHLLWCSEHETDVSKGVWTFLDDNSADPSLDLLIGRTCLLLDDGKYVSPDEVYWGSHPFGRWRYTLGPQFRSWQSLLDRLRVAEGPHPRDAVEVLQDVAAQHGGEQAPLLQADVPVVLNCWRILSDGLASGELTTDELAELHTDEVVLDGQNWLRSPGEVFFRDSLNLAGRFGAEVRARLIDRPEGLWPALTAAGVRNLSDAVVSHVVEREGGSPEGQVADRLRSRNLLLLRVLGDDVQAMQRLHDFHEAVDIRHLTRLEIQQSLSIGSEQFSSAPYPRAALYLPHDRTLLCVERSDTAPVWVEVARELIRALRIERGQPSVLASAVKIVLEADTTLAASAELDELGFPALDRLVVEAVEGTVVGELGGTPDDDFEELDADEASGGSVAVDSPAGSGTDQQPLTEDPDGDETEGEEQAEESPESSGGDASTGAGSGGASGGGTGETNGATGKKGAKGAEVTQSRLRSYVAPAAGGAADATDNDGEDEVVERAGVDAVLAYEREHGRTPNEMPPMNPGFDVRSVGPDGDVRIIEIKATADSWGARGVALSSMQFTTAQQRREEFWLYVVDNALANPVVHAINDPASKVDQYFFDDGWRAVTEAEAAPRPPLEPLVLIADPNSTRDIVAYFDASNPAVGVPGAEDGWLPCKDPRPGEGWFAVRIAGFGLGLAFYGGVAVVEPTERDPEDGELALVLLRDQVDPDSGMPVALRRWTPERDLDGNQLALRLGSDGSVEPLTVARPEDVKVLGLVRATIRPDDLAGATAQPDP